MSFLHKCKADDTPVGPVTFLEYRKSGMRHMIDYVFQQTAEGTYLLSRREGWRDETVPQITVPASIAEELRNIAEEEHMRRYKSSYSPIGRVLDGWMWHLEIKFATGERVCSGGDNAYPDGEKGLKRVAEYLENVWNTYKDAPPAMEKPATAQDNVVYLKYDRSGTVAFPLDLYIFQQDKDGTYWLTNGSRCHRMEARKAKVPATLHTAILEIIEKDGIKSYQSYYEPEFQVLDGEMWSLEIKFQKGDLVTSSGSNAYPSGDGLDNLRALFIRTWKEVEAKAIPAPIEEP